MCAPLIIPISKNVTHIVTNIATEDFVPTSDYTYYQNATHIVTNIASENIVPTSDHTYYQNATYKLTNNATEDTVPTLNITNCATFVLSTTVNKNCL